MSYNPVNWVNGETPINDTNLNNMDQGIADAHEILAEHERKINDFANQQIPEEYVKNAVEDYISENQAGLASKEDVEEVADEVGQLSSEISNVVKWSDVNFATVEHRTNLYYNGSTGVFRDGNITGYTNEDNYLAYLIPIDDSWDYLTYEWLDPINSKSGASIYWRTLSEIPYDNAPRDIILNTFDYLMAVDNVTKMRVREVPVGTEYILFEVRNVNSDYSVQDALGKLKVCKGSVYIPSDLAEKSVLGIGRTKYIERIGNNIINADYRLHDTFHTLDDEIVSSELGTREFYLAGSTTLEMYAKFDEALSRCGRNYSKELIGYASDANGNDNTDLPIYCYHLYSNINFPEWTHSKIDTILAVGCIHGDEKLSTYSMYKMIEEINNGHSSALNGLLCAYNIDLVPIANPYGYDLSQRRNARGVDLNRNFTVGWEEFKAKFDNGELKQYYNPGASFLSEKETQALHYLIDRNKDNYVALIDVHNRGLYDDYGASAVLYQIYSNNTDLRKNVIHKIANVDSAWKEEYGYSLIDDQYDGVGGSVMEIEGGISTELPQLVNEFNSICGTDVCCDIELPWAFYEDGSPKWRFAHPFQLIAIDGFVNTLLGIKKCIDK